MMRIELGLAVMCSDGPAGEVADVVVDPLERTVTHLVVAPHHKHYLARLVPISQFQETERRDGLRLGCTGEELRRYPLIEERAFIPLNEPLPIDDEWDVGVERVLGIPYYNAEFGDAPFTDGEVVVAYDRIPKHDVEIRRASRVLAADDHSVGDVDGFVVDDGDHITHIVLEHGHLWGRRDVAIPIGSVTGVKNDEVKLSLTRDEVGALPAVAVKRHH